MSQPKPLGDRPTVLVDGACGFCRRSASWARRQPGGDSMQFVAYQQVHQSWMDARMKAACHEALHVVVAEGQVLRGGEAACFVAERVGFGPMAHLLQMGPLAFVTEVAYRQIALHRILISNLAFTEAPDDEDLKAPTAYLGLACGTKPPEEAPEAA